MNPRPIPVLLLRHDPWGVMTRGGVERSPAETKAFHST
jgi:hypothetical protein